MSSKRSSKNSARNPNRHKVRCTSTLCSKEFYNDFVKRHTANEHSNLAKHNRLAPTIPVSQKVMNNPFDFVKPPAKRPHLESDNVNEKNA